MVNLTYDFNQIMVDRKWDVNKASDQMAHMVTALDGMGISKKFIVSHTGQIKQNDKHKLRSDEPYIECDFQTMILKVRHMTSLSDERSKEILDVCEKAVNEQSMFTGMSKTFNGGRELFDTKVGSAGFVVKR